MTTRIARLSRTAVFVLDAMVIDLPMVYFKSLFDFHGVYPVSIVRCQGVFSNLDHKTFLITNLAGRRIINLNHDDGSLVAFTCPRLSPLLKRTKQVAARHGESASPRIQDT